MTSAVPNLPQPADLTSLVLRVDFSDDERWKALVEALDETATCVSDPAFDGVTVEALVAADQAAAEDDRLFDLFVADADALADDEWPLLAVDLDAEPGRTFRVPAEFFSEVSANLAIANMDFADFADETDETGTFRGFA
jgi:uncharacterized protein DUF6924